MKKNNDSLFYTCSLIEYISRITKNFPKTVISFLGEYLKKIYNYADIFHCEPIEKVADDFIQKCNITNGNFDNITNSKYSIPDYWDIGDFQLRPYKIAGYIDGLLNGAKLSGIGTFNFFATIRENAPIVKSV